MSITVTKSDDTKQTFDDVLGFRTESETYFLSIGYEENSQVKEAAFGSGHWKQVTITP